MAETMSKKGQSKPARRRGHLTAAKFNKTIKLFPNLKEEMVEACRSVLVDGVSGGRAGKVAGVSRQLVNRYCDRIHKTYLLEIAGCPPNWRTETICAPPELMEEILSKVKEAKLTYQKDSSQ